MIANVVKDDNNLEQNKYVKIYREVNGERKGKMTLGVYNAGVERLAEKKGMIMKKLPRRNKMRPFVKTRFKIFTKPDSLSSTERGNTYSRCCFLILLEDLDEFTRIEILTVPRR